MVVYARDSEGIQALPYAIQVFSGINVFLPLIIK
jgi:hypothetical protein